MFILSIFWIELITSVTNYSSSKHGLHLKIFPIHWLCQTYAKGPLMSILHFKCPFVCILLILLFSLSVTFPLFSSSLPTLPNLCNCLDWPWLVILLPGITGIHDHLKSCLKFEFSCVYIGKFQVNLCHTPRSCLLKKQN